MTKTNESESINHSFISFPKIPRVFKHTMIITEKIDGTNAQVYIHEDGVTIQAGSRNRYITPESDNYGFAKWVEANKEELLKLGPGRHFGEWWGSGIQRGYGLKEKRFSLFNTGRWSNPESRPSCCDCVPVLYQGEFDTQVIKYILEHLKETGSIAAPGFMDVEGVVVLHLASNQLYKYTVNDNHKG